MFEHFCCVPVASVAFGFRWLLSLLAFGFSGFCGFCGPWLLVASVGFGVTSGFGLVWLLMACFWFSWISLDG